MTSVFEDIEKTTERKLQAGQVSISPKKEVEVEEIVIKKSRKKKELLKMLLKRKLGKIRIKLPKKRTTVQFVPVRRVRYIKPYESDPTAQKFFPTSRKEKPRQKFLGKYGF